MNHAAAMAQARRANESLEEFVDVASHDLCSSLRDIADPMKWVKEDLVQTCGSSPHGL